jgi:hypothetical protein
VSPWLAAPHCERDWERAGCGGTPFCGQRGRMSPVETARRWFGRTSLAHPDSHHQRLPAASPSVHGFVLGESMPHHNHRGRELHSDRRMIPRPTARHGLRQARIHPYLLPTVRHRPGQAQLYSSLSHLSRLPWTMVEVPHPSTPHPTWQTMVIMVEEPHRPALVLVAHRSRPRQTIGDLFSIGEQGTVTGLNREAAAA